MIIFMGMTAVSIGLTVLILGLHFVKSTKPPPEWLTGLVNNWLRPMLHCSRRRQSAGISPHVMKQLKHDNNDITGNHGNQDGKKRKDSLQNDSDFGDFDDIEHSKNVDAKLKVMYDLSNQIREITTRMIRKEKEGEAFAKWKEIANVLELFFFWLFMALMVLFTVVLLVIVPATQPDVSMEAPSP